MPPCSASSSQVVEVLPSSGSGVAGAVTILAVVHITSWTIDEPNREAGTRFASVSVRPRRLSIVSTTPAKPAQSHTALVRRARKVNRVLGETYPDARCELDFANPFELLVVTVLSAQTTDRRVNATRDRKSTRLNSSH